MNERIFFGPPGEFLGSGSDGVPVTGSDDGVEPMQEITTLVSGISVTQHCRACGHVVHNLGPLCTCGCTDGYPDITDAPPLKP